MSKRSNPAFRNTAILLSMVMAIAGCVTQPAGPTVPVMPGSNKPFEVFQQDQAVCAQYAGQQVGGLAQQANTQALGTAVVGTALGAGLGAAIGGGQGAAIGAASGAVAGTAVGASGAAYGQADLQQRYDIAYSQCMYAKGNQVPGYAYNNPPPPPPPPGAQPQSFTIYFDFDRSDLTADGAQVIDQAIAQIQRNGAAQIQVSGYTDAAGADSYNFALAQSRASAVRDYMVSHGIPANQILTRTFGKSDQRVPTANGVPEAQNRRVEIMVSPPANVSYGTQPPAGYAPTQP